MPGTSAISQPIRLLFGFACLLILILSWPQIAFSQTSLLSSSEEEVLSSLMSPHLTPEVLKELMVEDTSSEKRGGYVKFVVWLDEKNKDAQRIIFQNSKKLPYHADLLMNLSDFKGLTRQQIDSFALHAKSRRFLYGTLFIHQDPQNPQSFIFDYEFSGQDDVALNHIIQTNRLLHSTVDSSLSEDFRYAPQPTMVASAKQFAIELSKARIELVLPGQTTRRIVYHNSWSVGRIRVLTATQVEAFAQQGGISQFDILIVDRVPREIPPVAGLISATPTVASSHVALFAKMLDIPLVFEPDAFTNPNWTALDGKFVFIQSGEYKITTLTDLKKTDIDRLLEIKFPKIQLQPQLDLKRKDIVRVATLQAKDRGAYGGKAAQLGLVIQLFPNNSPTEALAIPTSFFTDYLASAKLPNGTTLQAFINAKLKSIAPMQTSLKMVSSTMSEIREAMKSTPIPSGLLSRITKELQANFKDSQVRLKLRSSSNIEDDDIFNGAGLYDSEGAWLNGAPVGKEKQTIERALNKVWRSLYSERAYLARRQFGVDEAKVAMAVLVQRAYKDEIANGVSIGQTESSSGYVATITGFPGEDLLVTHPADGKLPEIMNVNFREQTSSLRKMQSCTEIAYSQNLLTTDEYKNLANMMKQISSRWPHPSEKLELDFEWKLMKAPDGARQVIIKQVRPVPKPRMPVVGGKSGVLFVPSHEMKFTATYEESQESVAYMQRPRELSIEMGLITGADLKSGRVRADRIRVKLASGRVYEYTNILAKMEESVYQDGHRLFFMLPNPELPSLRLIMELAFSDDEPVMTIESSRARFQTWFQVSAKDLVSLRKTNISADGFWRWMLMPQEEVDTLNLYKKDLSSFNYNFTAGNVSIGVKGVFWDFGGRGNLPVYANIEQMRVRGLLAREIVITNPNAMAFAPLHHNIANAYAADLLGADGLTNDDRRTLRKLKARYLIISLGSYMTSGEEALVIGYFDESGLFTPLYGGPLQEQKTN